MVNDGWKSRKAQMAAAITFVASIALFSGHLTGDQWVSVVTLVLGIFGVANVMEKRTPMVSRD